MSEIANDLPTRAVDVSGAPPAGAWRATAAQAPETLARFRRLAALLVAADAASIVVALVVSHGVRFGLGTLHADFVALLVVSSLIWVCVFHGFGLYAIKHLPPAEELRRLFSATTFGVMFIVVATVWSDGPTDRLWLGVTWGVALVVELGIRRATRWHVRRQKRAGHLAMRTLIVGTNEESARIARTLEPQVRGFRPVGLIGTDPSREPDGGLPLLGQLDQLDATIRTHGAECVFVATTAVSALDMFKISRSCRRANVEMRVSANLPDVLTSRLAVHQVDDLTVLAVRAVCLTGAQAALKRSFDVVAAAIALAASLPLMAIIAVAIKLTSSGPVLFTQERATKDLRRFTMYKFRTMVPEPDRALQGRLIDLTRPFFKLQDDPRLTSVGRILRRLSLDELPQLWNVIRGDMSLVGPRPLPMDQVGANRELLEPRHEVRAGLTGLWQISGRSDVDPAEALRLDLLYIENWSLSLDLYIILKTVGALLSRTGAY